MSIPKEMFNQMQCCLSDNGHIVVDPVILPCKGNACKMCVITYMCSHCFKCNATHSSKVDIEKLPSNTTLKKLVEETYLVDLVGLLKQKIEAFEESTQDDCIDEMVNFVEMEIDIRVESLIVELHKYRDGLRDELFTLRDKFREMTTSRKLADKQEELSRCEFKATYRDYCKNQDNLIECQKELNNLKQYLSKLSFVPNDFKFDHNVVGQLKSPNLCEFNKVKTSSKIKIDIKQAAEGVYLKSKNQIVLADSNGKRLLVLDENNKRVKTIKHKEMQEPSYLAVDRIEQVFVLDGKTWRCLVFDKDFNFVRSISLKALSGTSSITIDILDDAQPLYIPCAPTNEIQYWSSDTNRLKKIPAAIESPHYVRFCKKYLYVSSQTEYSTIHGNILDCQVTRGANCVYVIDKQSFKIARKITVANWLYPYGLHITENGSILTAAYTLDEKRTRSDNRWLFVLDLNGNVNNKIELDGVNASNPSLFVNFFENKLLLGLSERIGLIEFE